MKRLIMFAALAAVVALAGFDAQAADDAGASGVDFSYAFAPPHRITVCRPESGDKTLLDLEPGALRMGWSYESLMTLPAGAFVTPPANWAVRMTPQVGGHGFAQNAWTRVEGTLPVLEATYSDAAGTMRLQIAGGETAAVIEVTMSNAGAETTEFSLRCESQRGFFGYNPGYVDSGRPSDCLLAGWGDRADRVILAAAGADGFQATHATTLCPVWRVAPGATRTAWLFRPYRAYASDLPNLRARDWPGEMTRACEEWRARLACPMRILVPDAGVERAFYACLADLFVMREPIQGGRMASAPGSDGYRAANTCESAIVAIALDQIGLHDAAADGYQVCLEWQGEDGDWADPQGWGHLMWIVPGFKSWAVMEHYRLARNLDYLAAVFPRMLANSRFQERQRARARVIDGGAKPLTYGLMPRGMGDCGLKDGDDLYGVFLPHNIWAVYADKMALEAANILGRADDAGELRRIYETALVDLTEALDRGAIEADGYRWIPGVPGKTTGSRWGALNALTPCGLLAPNHPLVEGTLRHIESQMSPGGLPLNTGWMPNGLWVAIALDNLAEAHLIRNEGDAAAKLLYATLNHGTPFYTWCEERGPTPGAAETTGDRQHLWTPVAVVRALRDMLVMEDGGALHLCRGIDRAWLASGTRVGVTGAETHFGTVSCTVQYDATARKVVAEAEFAANAVGSPTESPRPDRAVLHVRLPEGIRATGVSGEGALFDAATQTVTWEKPAGKYRVEITVE